ncbi:MAG: DUF4982 domain-containing protein [Cyclobacteriaceae bacterium]
MLRKIFAILFLLSFTHYIDAQNSGYQVSPRVKSSINASWKFHLGDPDESFFEESFDDEGWETVSVPHTLELASLDLNGHNDTKIQESFHRKVGWYRRSVEVEKDAEKVFLEFEGAHQVTDLWVNGKHVDQHRIGGYTPFHFDITSFVELGKSNQVTLLVDNRRKENVPPDPGPFDYVKFSGLYRDVYLVTTNKVRVTFNWEALKAGVRFTTPSVDPVNLNATISVETVVLNETESDKSLLVVNRLIDEKGLVVLRMQKEVTVKAFDSEEVSQIGGIEDDLKLWSIETPNLYRLNTSVYEVSALLDAVECKVGVRKFEHHPREGFLLNGQPIELIGANRHQHYGYIGDAMPNSLHRKDMEQFKQLGFNVVRTAHYPQDNALLEACDELGILVYEEAPTWIGIGSDAWFDNLEKAARTMVRNHRNHASVVIWGGGINHRGYVPQVHLAVKQEDPTRLTASQSSRWTGWQTSGMTDIYGQMVYGPVNWERHEPMLAMEGREGFKSVAENKVDPLKTGIISWNGHDYYTFHPSDGRWPEKVRPGGILDIFRHPYGKDVRWLESELSSEPYLHIMDEWSSETKEVTVYSNANEVELIVNGKPIERRFPEKGGVFDSLDHPPFKFQIEKYEKGTLMAKGWKDNRVVAESSKRTFEKAFKIKLVIDTLDRSHVADGSDIIQAYAYVVDKNGTVLKDAKNEVNFSVKGPASIVGDNADIGANPVKMYRGNAPALIRSDLTAGKITLSATASGLKSDKASWESIQHNPVIKDQPYLDKESLRVDLGGEGQLLQFGWKPWTEKDNTPSSEETFDIGESVDISITSGSGEGVIRWLGEMNVMGKYGYAIGEGVLCIDEKGLQLKFEDLPNGKYLLQTYHHAPRSNTDSMDPNKDKLKSLNALRIPYAKELKVEVIAQGEVLSQDNVSITEGNILPSDGAAVSEMTFERNGNGTITVLVTDQDLQKGVWLNAFELVRFID